MVERKMLLCSALEIRIVDWAGAEAVSILFHRATMMDRGDTETRKLVCTLYQQAAGGLSAPWLGSHTNFGCQQLSPTTKSTCPQRA